MRLLGIDHVVIRARDPARLERFYVDRGIISDPYLSAVAGSGKDQASAGKDWIKVHSSYSGKTAKTETKAEATARWKLADSKGMIRTRAIYQLAKNCYGCHVVPQEELVNKGGHRAGTWRGSSVRHSCLPRS